jgi:hypothetical protein
MVAAITKIIAGGHDNSRRRACIRSNAEHTGAAVLLGGLMTGKKRRKVSSDCRRLTRRERRLQAVAAQIAGLERDRSLALAEQDHFVLWKRPSLFAPWPSDLRHWRPAHRRDGPGKPWEASSPGQGLHRTGLHPIGLSTDPAVRVNAIHQREPEEAHIRDARTFIPPIRDRRLPHVCAGTAAPSAIAAGGPRRHRLRARERP